MRSFRIPSVPPTTMKCVRFPNDVIDNVEELIVGKDCTFSAFVVEAVRAAIDAVRSVEVESTTRSEDTGWE